MKQDLTENIHHQASDVWTAAQNWRQGGTLELAEIAVLDELAQQMPKDAHAGELHFIVTCELARFLSRPAAEISRVVNRLVARGIVMRRGDCLGILDPAAAMRRTGL